jgi:hypothetical protein
LRIGDTFVDSNQLCGPDNRDKRVEGWRSFQTAGGPSKKKKKKAEVLG